MSDDADKYAFARMPDGQINPFLVYEKFVRDATVSLDEFKRSYFESSACRLKAHRGK